MFTGIIRHEGRLAERKGARLRFDVPREVAGTLQPGSSIAVNGVCLTAVECSGAGFSADVVPETERKTTLAGLPDGSAVHLELPARTDATLDGHLVQGHVDGVGTVRKVQPEGNAVALTVGLAPELVGYLVPKGSVAIDGVSLTIADVADGAFTVSLIPHTRSLTHLGQLRLGDSVNIEVDIISKYAKHHAHA